MLEVINLQKRTYISYFIFRHDLNTGKTQYGFKFDPTLSSLIMLNIDNILNNPKIAIISNIEGHPSSVLKIFFNDCTLYIRYRNDDGYSDLKYIWTNDIFKNALHLDVTFIGEYVSEYSSNFCISTIDVNKHIQAINDFFNLTITKGR